MPQSDGADGNGGGGKFNVFKRLGLSRHVIREEAWGRNFGGWSALGALRIPPRRHL